ncbi:hypothetical protein PIB30_107409 [Stylosanthes scabra]|uniref:Uncharacterized protein n=1 Tax=Stylosanthes scabra TaxID=79078 RepID=A0ABU6SZV3_9FABA|nr:hypothetical protein [Stylosanthes scabra]
MTHILLTTHGSRFCHVTTWFKREPPKAPTNFTHAPLNHVFSTPQHDPNLTPIKKETSGARPSQPRLTFEPRYNVVQTKQAKLQEHSHEIPFEEALKEEKFEDKTSNNMAGNEDHNRGRKLADFLM